MVAKEFKLLEKTNTTRGWITMQNLCEFRPQQLKRPIYLTMIQTLFRAKSLFLTEIISYKSIQKVKFLDEPWVVEAHDPQEYNILIEPMLDRKYMKFNDNMGMVKGKAAQVSVDELIKSIGNVDLAVGLGVIEESSDVADSDEGIFITRKFALKYSATFLI